MVQNFMFFAGWKISVMSMLETHYNVHRCHGLVAAIAKKHLVERESYAKFTCACYHCLHDSVKIAMLLACWRCKPVN